MWRDEHTGLYHTHYRIYNPQFARWLTPDPAGYMNGMNLYRFYGGPNGVDPLGLLLGTTVDSINLALLNGAYDFFTINGLLTGRDSNETIDPYHWLDNQEFKESYYTARVGVEALITIGTFGISAATKTAGWAYRGKKAYTIWDTAGNVSNATKGIMDINQKGLNWSNGTQTVGGALGFGFNVYGATKGFGNSIPKPRINIQNKFKKVLNSDGSIDYHYGNYDYGHGININIRNGTLGFEISRSSQHAESGIDMFASAMLRINADKIKIKSIRGFWLSNSDSVNYSSFTSNLGKMSHEASALNTWSGRIAQKYGFNKVSFPDGLPSINDRYIKVLFGKGKQ